MTERMPQGFTLVEVLVALVITALLFGVIGSALANSSARAQSDRLRSKALLLAEAEIAARSDAPFVAGEDQRTVGAWRMTVHESLIARDPRQFMLLSEIAVEVRDADDRRWARLSRRAIKRAPAR